MTEGDLTVYAPMLVPVIATKGGNKGGVEFCQGPDQRSCDGTGSVGHGWTYHSTGPVTREPTPS
jgi:hypothetical protein